MNLSQHELQQAVDIFLEMIGQTVTKSGQLTLHFEEGRVVRYELNQVMRPMVARPCRRDGLPVAGRNGHDR